MKKSRMKMHDLSRIMIHILGRSPHEYGLVPDMEGFVSFKEFLWALKEEPGWAGVSRGVLNEVLMSDERHLFETKENSIRAVSRQWEFNFDLAAEHVPSILYTPVRRKAHFNALDRGLPEKSDQFYILSSDRDMAEKIGKRKDHKPVILEVMSGRASDEGTFFYPFGDLFLTREILAGYIAGPPVPKGVIKAREARPVKKKDTESGINAGTFTMDSSRDPDVSRRKKGRKKKGWREELRGKRRKG